MALRGGERVLQKIYELYPSCVYTLVKQDHILHRMKINPQFVNTSFIQHLPFAKTCYRYYFPLFPSAIESLDVQEYDLILSSSHSVAKGIRVQPHQLHICYCHCPMRYAWDLYDQYMASLSGFKKIAAQIGLKYMRKWDVKRTPDVHHFIANSYFVKERIKKIYGREAAVIYPPVMTHLMELKEKEDFYLTVAHFVPYKKIDLIVEAFSYFPNKCLLVVGDGPEWKKIKAKAGKNVELLGYQEDDSVRDLLSRAKGFIFAAEEDFGIALVEAQAAGTAVIAYGKGGALETVVEGKTGIFFHEQTLESLLKAIRLFEGKEFDPGVIKKHAEQFSSLQFCLKFKEFVEEKWRIFCEGSHSCRR